MTTVFILTGQIQEEEEKEAQETWQEKEKEGGVSVGLGARLAEAALSPNSQLVVLFLPLASKQTSPIQLWSSRLKKRPTDL